MPRPAPPDPVYRNARREACIILAAWLSTLCYCCGYCTFFGYLGSDGAPPSQPARFVMGIPQWFFWGVIAPWVVCGVFTFWFAGWYMAEDDLGTDHAAELERDIREDVGG